MFTGYTTTCTNKQGSVDQSHNVRATDEGFNSIPGFVPGIWFRTWFCRNAKSAEMAAELLTNSTFPLSCKSFLLGTSYTKVEGSLEREPSGCSERSGE